MKDILVFYKKNFERVIYFISEKIKMQRIRVIGIILFFSLVLLQGLCGQNRKVLFVLNSIYEEFEDLNAPFEIIELQGKLMESGYDVSFSYNSTKDELMKELDDFYQEEEEFSFLYYFGHVKASFNLRSERRCLPFWSQYSAS